MTNSDHDNKQDDNPHQNHETITFTTGQPVKARRYYRDGTGRFEKHRQTHDLYVIGDRKNGKISYTSDVRDVQAYSSTATFIYSPTGMTHEEMEQFLKAKNLWDIAQIDRIKLYRNGERIHALKVNQHQTIKDLNVVRKKYEEIDYVSTNHLEKDKLDYFEAVLTPPEEKVENSKTEVTA